jgi:putative FmdB family regulatory protein
MPLYEFQCQCGYEFEDILSLSDPLPNKCEECGAEGKIRKLISLPAYGKVELYGQELKNHLKADAKKMMKKAETDQNLLGALVGSDRLHTNELTKAKIRSESSKVKRSTKKS